MRDYKQELVYQVEAITVTPEKPKSGMFDEQPFTHILVNFSIILLGDWPCYS